MKLSSIDVNLLVMLDVVLTERSITDAARRMNLSQSAVSNALARARRLFGDPLLVRNGSRMVPTKRADAMRPHLRAALRQLEKAVFHADFDPSTASCSFRIAMTEHVQVVMLKPLLQRLAAKGPRIRLDICACDGGSELEALESNSVDLAIGCYRSTQINLRASFLFADRWVGVTRDGLHLPRHLSIERLAATPRIHFAPYGHPLMELEVQLENVKPKREVYLTTPHLLPLPAVLYATDAILLTPERVANHMVVAHPLRIYELPLALHGLQASQVWHASRDEDESLFWLRREIDNLAKKEWRS